MENQKLNIPWALIEFHLQLRERNKAWLSRKLNVDNNVITNWKSRGGAPAMRATELARVLDTTVGELLGEQEFDSNNKRMQTPPYVTSLIKTVLDLYAAGAPASIFQALVEIVNLLRQSQMVQGQSQLMPKPSWEIEVDSAADPFDDHKQRSPAKKVG